MELLKNLMLNVLNVHAFLPSILFSFSYWSGQASREIETISFVHST